MIAICIQYLKPGQRFRLACDPTIVGTFVECTGCSAKVNLDRGVRDVEFEDHNGHARHFRATRSKATTWALATLVEPLFDVPEGATRQTLEDSEMATKTKTKKSTKTKAAVAKPKEAKAPKAKKERKPKAEKDPGKMSALDAAAKVLAEAGAPMNTKTMIEKMEAAGYWKSPGGKTPHATLYSAILREIDTKKGESRFVKHDRGTFDLRK